jgi:hypothetical protein
MTTLRITGLLAKEAGIPEVHLCCQCAIDWFAKEMLGRDLDAEKEAGKKLPPQLQTWYWSLPESGQQATASLKPSETPCP